jgi:hypothetical protein
MRSILLVLLTIFIAQSVYSQHSTFYYNSNFGVIDNEVNAKYKREVIPRKFSANKLVNTYILEDQNWVKQKKEIYSPINDTLIQIKRP